MKNAWKYTAPLLLVCLYQINAQQVTKTDTLSGTPLSISMDKRIESTLTDIENKCSVANAKNENKKWGTSSANEVRTISVPNRELTTAEVCRKNPRISGYKIQLAVVKSNAEANQIKADFRKKFPSLKVETDASLRPNYKILAGSYFTKQSASGDLAKIKQHFKSAIPVQYRIFCVEAK